MDLFLMAGLVRPSDMSGDARKSPEAVQLLVDEASRFLLGGGRLSMAEWSALTPIEREAFASAGKILAVTAAIRAGAAAQGVEGAADVAAEVDEGRAKDRVRLARAVARTSASDRRSAPMGAG